MSDRLTRQGVRDLGNNSRPGKSRRHVCVYSAMEVVGWRRPNYMLEYEPIYGRRCLVCGARE